MRMVGGMFERAKVGYPLRMSIILDLGGFAYNDCYSMF